jgi:hypothetical protein
MNYTEPSQEEKKALHIAFVSVSCLSFEEIIASVGTHGKIDFMFQSGGNMYTDTNGNDFLLTKGQMSYLVKWLSYSR